MALWLLLSFAMASVVDRVIAVVDDEVVLASDTRMDATLSLRDPSTLPFWTRKTPRERQLEAAIIRSAAGDIQLYKPTEDASRARLEALRSSFADRADWVVFLERWGLDEPGMRAVLERRLVVEMYLSRNVQAAPSDHAAWNAECDTLLADLTSRVRLRLIDPSPR